MTVEAEDNRTREIHGPYVSIERAIGLMPLKCTLGHVQSPRAMSAPGGQLLVAIAADSPAPTVLIES
jgi:hypothetical protein